jgi:hypothetical protein
MVLKFLIRKSNSNQHPPGWILVLQLKAKTKMGNTFAVQGGAGIPPQFIWHLLD